MKGAFGHVIDTIIRVSRVPADQADAAALTFTVIKNRHRPESPMPERLKRCRPDELQIVVPAEFGGKYRAMASSWSAEVEPGQYVRRKRDSAMDGPDVVKPDGMVVANRFSLEHPSEGNDQILVLFFR